MEKKNMKMMFKKFMAVAMVSLMVFSLAGCGNDSKKESSLDAIKKKGTLIVGTAPGYPPFEFMQYKDGKGELVGADIDMAKIIAEKLGVKLEFKTMEFDSLIAALTSGKIDMAITGMTPTEERKKSVDFSDIYYTGENSVVVKDGTDIGSIDQLKNEKVGVQRGSTQEIYAKDELKCKEIKSLPVIPDLINDLKNGNINAVIANTTVAKINVKKYEGIKIDDKIKLTGDKSADTAAIAIKKGDNEALLKEVNKIIKELKDSGEYEKIMDKNIDIASKQ